jgi:hypothetical protein
VTTKIYWACIEDEWMRATEPEPVIKRLLINKKSDKKNPGNNIAQCPSISLALHNMYAMRSIYSYNFKIDKGEVLTDEYNQNFFNSHVTIRDLEQKFFSFSQYYIFFTEENSLEITAYIHPFAENNEVSRRTWSIPGSFDIGKWFRPLEFNFYLKDEFDEFSIKEGDFYTYIKFNTKDKIKFRQFLPSEKIKNYIGFSVGSQRNSKAGIKSLNDYYKMLTYKNKIIKEIKSNLI